MQICIILTSLLLVRSSHGTLWGAEDAYIVDDDGTDDDFGGHEAGEEVTTSQSRIPDEEGTCSTKAGLRGQCIKSRDCFPYLYLGNESPGNLQTSFNTGLWGFVNSTAEPCELENGGTDPTREAVKPGDELVCCVTLALTRQFQLPNWSQRPPTPQQKQPLLGPGIGTTAKKPVCGLTDYWSVEKIVGGRPAFKGEFPWTVALIRDGKQFCGGSLIDSRTVVTAAHCVDSLRTSSLLKTVKVVIGDHDLSTTTDAEHIVRQAKRLIFHKKFDQHRLNYDVALLILDKPVIFTKSIMPVCLHKGNPALDGGQINADVTGWGQIYSDGPQSQKLMTAKIRVWTNSECSQRYHGTSAPPITSGMVCAGVPSKKDSCRGDSGGPLTLNVNGIDHLIGIVSWGIECGTYPGVYTRIEKYLSWIEKYSVAE